MTRWFRPNYLKYGTRKIAQRLAKQFMYNTVIKLMRLISQKWRQFVQQRQRNNFGTLAAMLTCSCVSPIISAVHSAQVIVTLNRSFIRSPSASFPVLHPFLITSGPKQKKESKHTYQKGIGEEK